MAGELDKLEYLLQVKVEGQESVDRAAQSFKPVGANASSASVQVDALTRFIDRQVQSQQNFVRLLTDVARGIGNVTAEQQKAATETLKDMMLNKELENSYAALRREVELAADAKERDHTRTTSLIGRGLLRQQIQEQKDLENAAAAANREISQMPRLLQALTGAVPGGLGGRGIMGLIGSPVGAGVAGAAGALALVAATLSLASATGEYAREQQNLAAKTGLSVEQTQLWSQAAKVTGVNVTSLVTQMRTLSRAMAENSDEGRRYKQALRELGFDQSVTFQEPGAAFQQIFTRVSQLQNPFDRERLASTLGGRGGLEALPWVGQLNDLNVQLRAAGAVMDKEGIQKAAGYERELMLLGIQWDALKRRLGEKAIGTIEFVLQGRSLAEGIGLGAQALINPVAAAGEYFLGSYLHGPRTSPAGLQALSPERFKPPFADPFAMMRSDSAASVQSYLNRSTGGGRPGQQLALERQLKDAETTLAGLTDRLSDAILITPKDRADLAAANSKVLGLRQRQSALGQAPEIEERSASLADKAELRPYGRLGELEEQRRAMERRYDREISENPSLRPLLEKTRGLDRGNLNQEIVGEARLESMNQNELRGRFESETRILGAEQYEKQMHGFLEPFLKQTGKQLDTEAELGRIGRTGERDDVVARANREQRFGALTAPPGDEARSIGAAYLRQIGTVNQLGQFDRQTIGQDDSLDNDQKKIELARLEQQVRKETIQAQIEGEEKLLELQHKRIEQAEQEAHQIAGALLTRGGMRDFVRDQAHGFEQQVLGNVLTPVVQQIGAFGGSAAGGQRGANGNLNWLGKALQGTFLADKGTTNLPLDRNTISTDENTRAMVALTGTIAPGSTDQGAAASGQGATPSSGDLPAAASGPGAASGRQWMGTTLPGAGSSAYSNLITPLIFGALGASTGNALATEFEKPTSYSISEAAAKTWKPPLFAHPTADIAGGAAGVATGIGMDFWKPHGTQGTAGSAAGNPLLAVQNQALAHLENIDASVSGNRNNGTTGLNTNLAGVGGIPIVNSGGAPALQSGAGDISANPFLAPLGMDAWSPDGTAFGGAITSGGGRGGSDLSGMPSGTEAWSPAAMAPLITSSLKQAGAIGGPGGGPLNTVSAYGAAAQFAGPVASGTTGLPVNISGMGGIPIINSGGVPSLQSAAGSDYSSDLSSNPFLAPLTMDAWSPASTAFGGMSSTTSAYGTGVVPDLSAPESGGASSDLSDLPLSMSSWSPLPIAGPGLSDLNFGASIPLVSAGGLSGVTSSAFTSQLSQFSKALSTVSGGGGAASLWDAMSGAAGTQTGPRVGQAFTPASRAGTIVGGLGTIAAGTLSAISQFSKGGVRGDLGGTSAILNTAGTLAGGPTNPIGMALDAGGMVTGLISALLPNPRQAFAKATNLAQQQESFMAPPTISRTVDTNGNNVAYDSLGHPYSTTSQGYSVTEPSKQYLNGNYYTIPGYSLQNYSSPAEVSPGSVYGPTYSTPGSSGVTLQMSVQALDSKSILDRSSDIGAAVLKELQQGGALGQRVQSTVLGS